MASIFLSSWKQVAAGKTPMRALMNCTLRAYRLEDVVLDVGGGVDPSYFSYLQGKPTEVRNLDKQHGIGAAADIDFEKDQLPYPDGSIDQVLLLNVLEHVYNHAFLAGECRRVLKEGKGLIGFVPFLIGYHPDPRDYFRYTDEALRMIFARAGFSKIEVRPVGGGPFVANANTLASFMPRFYNAIAWPFYCALDRFVLALRPGLARRFPLGYLFVLTK